MPRNRRSIDDAMGLPRTLCVVHDPWTLRPLAWIHRAEARSIASELAALGVRVELARFDEALLVRAPQAPLLLRVSDPVMRAAAGALSRASIRYFGPGAPAIERCYDKYGATRSAAAAGIDCPPTQLAGAVDSVEPPAVLKPRRGSDSIGLRVLRETTVPAHMRSEDWIVQPLVRGIEITIAVLGDRIGAPLQIELPEGTPYSFTRKYLAAPRRAPLEDRALAQRAQQQAEKVAKTLGVDWAARIDWIRERASGRLMFLECDAAPLVGARSAFAQSLAAAGIERREQLRLLVGG